MLSGPARLGTYLTGKCRGGWSRAGLPTCEVVAGPTPAGHARWTAPDNPWRDDMSTEIVEKYFDVWNEADNAKRLALAQQTWARDSRYVDPNTDVTGAGGFSEMVAAVHQQYPGYGFRLSSAVETHHDVLRFSWEIVDPDGNVAMSGIDV